MLDLVTSEAPDIEEPEFFAPVSYNVVDDLVGQYNHDRQQIETVSEFFTNAANGGTLRHFVAGNVTNDRYTTVDTRKLFETAGAVASLNSAYWSEAMRLTDIYEAMPQKRREEWNEQIRKMTCPDFEEETVRSTFQGLLAARLQFLSERVDGIFRGLSGEHVTNSPAAFGKRMIINRVLSEFGTTSHDKVGLIADLRCVIAKFMGRDDPSYCNTDAVMTNLKNGPTGSWVTLDGGAIRLCLYKTARTAHMEVHPDMAWRLNQILANLYPSAIPSKFRTKPPRQAKVVPLMKKLLSFQVVNLLSALEPGCEYIKQEDNWRQPYRYEPVPNSLQFKGGGPENKHVLAEVEIVLETIGAVKEGRFYRFDYNPVDVVAEIVALGAVPDEKSHQFYPTPAKLAERAVELAEIGDEHSCLEPSAGTGGLADFLPKGRTTCVEVAELRVSVLKAKGHSAVCADFMTWKAGQFDRIVMNPPFDLGRWKAHLEAAASLVAPGGRLVAILPSSARSTTLEGFTMAWHGPIENAFPGVSVSVVILVADRQP